MGVLQKEAKEDLLKMHKCRVESRTQFRREAALATIDMTNMAAMATGQMFPSGKKEKKRIMEKRDKKSQ